MTRSIFGCALGMLFSSFATIRAQEYQWTILAGKPGGWGNANGHVQDARFNGPCGLALDADGSLFVVDANNAVIRKIGTDGMVVTFAGQMRQDGLVDGAADAARFNFAQTGSVFSPAGGVAVALDGTVYVADTANHGIRKIQNGQVTLFAGDPGGLAGSANGRGTLARFNQPRDLCIDSNDNLYVADSSNNMIRKVTPAGDVTTFAGALMAAFVNGNGSTARFKGPRSIAIDAAGTLYVADTGNHSIRKILSNGDVTTLAGTGFSGYTNGVGTSARFNLPTGVAIGSSSEVFVAESGSHTIRRITSSGMVTTLAGSVGAIGSIDGPGTTARFNGPSSVEIDTEGNLYVSDSLNHIIRKITSVGVVSTLAGAPESPGNIDSEGLLARFDHPSAIAAGQNGNLYIEDSGNRRVRHIDCNGQVNTLSYQDSEGFVRPQTFTSIAGLALHPDDGRLYVLDSDTRKTLCALSLEGGYSVSGAEYSLIDRHDEFISLIGLPHGRLLASNGNTLVRMSVQGATEDFPWTLGDGFEGPVQIARDDLGNIYVATTGDRAVWKVSPRGDMEVIGGHSFVEPSGVAIDLMGNLYVTDPANHTVHKIDNDGTVSTIGGSPGVRGGSGGRELSAYFTHPNQVAVDSCGTVYVTDALNHCVMKGMPTPVPQLSLLPYAHTADTVTLKGTVNPRGARTTAQFEYGPTPDLGTAVPVEVYPADGNEILTVAITLDHLQPGEQLYYRLRATNSFGTSKTMVRMCTLRPSMTVSGRGKSINSGSRIPSRANGTDFGSIPFGSAPVDHTFTISNAGSAPLLLTDEPSVLITGPDMSSFALKMKPVPVIGIGSASAFSITFVPSRPGLHRATVHVPNNDQHHPAYRFSLQAFVGPLPRRSQIINFTTPTTVYENQSPLRLEASASSGEPVHLVVLSGTAALSGNYLFWHGTGRIKIVAMQGGNNFFRSAPPVTRVIEVRPEPSRPTLHDLRQTYDGSPRSVSVAGAEGPVTVVYKRGSQWVADPPVNAGLYPVKVTYGATTQADLLVINKAPLHVLPDDQRKLVGQPMPELTFTYAGFVNDEDASVLKQTPTLKVAANPSSPRGAYPIYSSGGLAANYIIHHHPGVLTVQSYAGRYEGLFGEPGDTRSLGKAELTVAADSQTFTGTVNWSGLPARQPIAGRLELDAMDDSFRAPLSFDLPDGNSISLNIALGYKESFDILPTSYVDALDPSSSIPYLVARLAEIPVRAAEPYAGDYTGLMLVSSPDPDADAPQGSGWATASIDTKGILLLAGKTADGTAFASTTRADDSKNPVHRLFKPLFTPGRQDCFLSGAITLKPHPALVNRRRTDAAELYWHKGTYPADPVYPDGFALALSFYLDPWQKPVGDITLVQRLGLDPFHPRFGSAFWDVESESSAFLPTLVTLDGGTIKFVEPLALPFNSTRWTAIINSRTGVVSGSFLLSDLGITRSVPFSGVLTQSSALLPGSVLGSGYFLIQSLPDAGVTKVLSRRFDFKRLPPP